MTVLTKARGVRFRLLCKAAVQLMATAGLALAAFSVGAGDGAMSLFVCLAISLVCGYFAVKTLRLRASFAAQAKAESILRSLIPDFTEKGWVLAKQRNLPPDSRGYTVIFQPSGEVAFVIGLSGGWPDRGYLEDPQRVASELTSYGTAHVPVVLAAFITDYADAYPSGVLAATPSRLLDSLEETVEAFFRERAERLDRLRLANLPREPVTGTVSYEDRIDPETAFEQEAEVA